MWLDKLLEDILIAEYDGQTFNPYRGNTSISAGFKTYAECREYIDENWVELREFTPSIGWGQGLGDYRTNFSSLMRVVDKILQENKHVGGPFGFRTFGISPEGTYLVRLDSSPLAQSDKLIDAIFEQVIKYLKGLKS